MLLGAGITTLFMQVGIAFLSSIIELERTFEVSLSLFAAVNDGAAAV